jgi:hypothetical protein
LSNHHALTVLALFNTFLLPGESEFKAGAKRRLRMLLDWQIDEGWFPEYDGCDPGYLTATIDFLAKYHRKSDDPEILEPLKSAVRFAAQLIHPDGSYGGEYGSRNTSLFFPHGFELLAPHLPEAAYAAELYIEAMRADRRVHLDDDRLCAHLAYNHLQAYLDWWMGRKDDQTYVPPKGKQYWKGAKLYTHRDEHRFCVLSAGKGGVLKLFVEGEPVHTDGGLIARLANGRTLVSHQMDRYDIVQLENGIQVEGRLGICKFRLPSPFTQALFHLGMLVVGPWASNMVRKLLQRLLIVGKRAAPFKFRRTLAIQNQITLVDEIWRSKNAGRSDRVLALHAGTDHTSIYVAVSQSYYHGKLRPWTDLGEHVEALNRVGYVRIERTVG